MCTVINLNKSYLWYKITWALGKKIAAKTLLKYRKGAIEIWSAWQFLLFVIGCFQLPTKPVIQRLFIYFTVKERNTKKVSEIFDQ